MPVKVEKMKFKRDDIGERERGEGALNSETKRSKKL